MRGEQARIAPPPRRIRRSSDLLRLLPYLMPYRARWVAMFVVGAAEPRRHDRDTADDQGRHRRAGAAPGSARPVDARGVAALAVGIAEAVLWFVRRWLVARATMGVEADIRKDLYARLQILPMAFHGRWQSGQLLSRVMNDLPPSAGFLVRPAVPLHQHPSDQVVVTAILLAMYWPLGVVVLAAVVPIVADGAALRARVHRLSRQVQDQPGDVATHVEEGGARPAGHQGVRPRRVRLRAVRRARAPPLRHPVDKVRVSARFWTLPRGHPEPHPDPRAAASARSPPATAW